MKQRCLDCFCYNIGWAGCMLPVIPHQCVENKTTLVPVRQVAQPGLRAGLMLCCRSLVSTKTSRVLCYKLGLLLFFLPLLSQRPTAIFLPTFSTSLGVVIKAAKISQLYQQSGKRTSPTSMEWSRSQVLHLVSLYHDHPALWDTSDVRFKDRQAKRLALMSISSKIGLPPMDVEKKIHCLRTQFNREYLKMKTSNRKPTWFAYLPLAFVLRNKQEISEEGNQWKFPTVVNVKDEIIEDCDYDIEMKGNDEETTNINDETQGSEDIETNSGVEVILHESGPNTMPPHTSSSNAAFGSLGHPSKYLRVASNLFSSSACGGDELATFGKFLQDELLKVNDFYTLQLAKFEISKILFQATTGVFDSATEKGVTKLEWSPRPAQVSSYNLVPSLEEIRTFSNVVTNELRTITNNYTLQVAKFFINQVIFHATTSATPIASSTTCDSEREQVAPSTPSKPLQTPQHTDRPATEISPT